MTISAQDRLKGLLVIIALASAWASLVALVMVFTDHSSGSFISKIFAAILLGPVVGGSLALVVHSFLRKVLGWLAGLHAIVGLAVLVALKIPYYGLAWPGIKIGELLGIVSFAPVAASIAPEDTWAVIASLFALNVSIALR